MWTTRGRGFKVGFDAEAMGIGKVGPSGEWHRSKTDEGWGEYSSEGSTKLVVFFGGIRFNYTWMMGKDLKPTYGGGQLRVPVTEQIPSPEQGTTMLLDEEDEVGGEILAVLPDPDNNGSNILLECEEYID
ncbi:hypothetical protein JR316_0012277 [Psilocybe cubensis]|nr:hypothetical protein JR316_0012277 [Psilocybe cubensis]KAH9475166.1 hypothetical protein JR316_0012277 [Psilocybe cubensis]